MAESQQSAPSEAVWIRVLNDIATVPRAVAGLGFTPLSVRYEAASAAVAVLRRWHVEAE